MRELCRLEEQWDGRYWMMREPEGWYAVAVYNGGKRHVPVLFAEDFSEVAEEIQYRSCVAASEFVPVREYICVPRRDSDSPRSFGAEFDQTMNSWYVPDDLHNLVGLPLDKWRDPSRLAFLNAELQEELRRLRETPPSNRFFLNVPFKEKDEVKLRGAVYDARKKAWYIDAHSSQVRFAKWIPHDVEVDFTPEELHVPDGHLTYPLWLFVPAEDRARAQGRGAVQNQDNGLWYAPVGAKPENFDEWTPPRRPGPKSLFLQFLKSIGFDEQRNDGKPIAVQQKHAFFVPGDEASPSGQYCLYMKKGELAAGWANNARTKAYQRWTYPYAALDLSNIF